MPELTWTMILLFVFPPKKKVLDNFLPWLAEEKASILLIFNSQVARTTSFSQCA
jgi:hypothetical protein